MKLSIIIPTYNDKRNLVQCLRAIFKSSKEPREVIVVDDASDDGTGSIQDEFEVTYLKHGRNRGPGAARNTGASVATGEVLLFIDSNVQVRDDTIRKVMNAHENPEISIYQGIASKKAANEGFGPELLALNWYYMLHGINESTFIHSHVFSIKKSVFDEFNGFDESFKPPGFGEEFEFGSRLRKKYILHTDPNMVVDHSFQRFWPRVRSVYHRAQAWGRIYMKTKQFEKANASSSEAAVGILNLLGLFTLLLVFFSWYFLVISLGISLCPLILKRKFFKFLKVERGLLFTIRAIIPVNIWAVSAVLGGIAFFLKYIIMGSTSGERASMLRSISFRKNKLPSHVVLFANRDCNLKCTHCFYWDAGGDRGAGGGDVLTLEELEKISKGFRHVKMLTITGGEPSLRDDLPLIIRAFYKNCGLEHVTLHTNGFSPEKILKIARETMISCPSIELNVSVSIDGPPVVHDKIRGRVGAHKKATSTVSLLKREKIRMPRLNVTVNACFQRENQDSITPFIEGFYKEFQPDGFYLSFVRGNTRDPSARNASIEKYRRAIDKLERIKRSHLSYSNYTLAGLRNAIDTLAPRHVIKIYRTRRMMYPCKAGKSVVVIYENGDVAPCEMLHRDFGNIRNHDYQIGSILATPRALSILKSIGNHECACTWECAVMNNMVFNYRAYPSIFLALIMNRLHAIIGR
ncbi:MAG: glycosyltransferase [Promethearchaeota archaeon]